ncbi:hypothetical protein C2845_PM15G04730 [Panicum miliaceum]|uniref:Uncharacterized protein n=1 Tax=Panicum miliaceum TaxID=4540 RepID=A0A3L6Q723_PANMI|nr:hypothetical protein C2845_PM15G04730 [Panicum miliaceum]
MVLILETSCLWRRVNFAVLYPTYFHPETAADVAAWQEKGVFAFTGAPHPWQRDTVRQEIFQQCGASSRCRLFCAVMHVFESSDFYLQPLQARAPVAAQAGAHGSGAPRMRRIRRICSGKLHWPRLGGVRCQDRATLGGYPQVSKGNRGRYGHFARARSKG